MYIYHFLSAANLAVNKLDPKQHFENILSGGVLLPKSRRDTSLRTWVTPRDPPSDWEYIFLTPRIHLHSIAIQEMRLSGNNFNKIIDGEYGFVFNSNNFRNCPNVFLREEDILSRNSANTMPFQNQKLVPLNEILYQGELDLSMSIAHIVNGTIIPINQGREQCTTTEHK